MSVLQVLKYMQWCEVKSADFLNNIINEWLTEKFTSYHGFLQFNRYENHNFRNIMALEAIMVINKKANNGYRNKFT